MADVEMLPTASTADTQRSVHFSEEPEAGPSQSLDNLPPSPNDDMPNGPGLSRDRKFNDSRRLRAEKEKLGHRRVDSETGEVTYKKVPTSQIINAIQFAITNSLASMNKTPDRDLLVQDFDVIEKFLFPSSGSGTSPPHPYGDFRFKCYAPVAFRYFRELFQIKAEDYLSSVCGSPMIELSNPGASGSIFYISSDDQFILKTVQSKEAEFLTKLLPGYYMNLNQNPRTLLPKFFGLYCYQNLSKNIRLVVMNNLLPSSLKMHLKYDLKGSTYKRKASKSEREKNSPTLKDIDFLEQHPDGLYLESETYDALMKTISRDCLVLESFKIMDYSLLIGIHNIDQAQRERGIDRRPVDNEQQSSTSKENNQLNLNKTWRRQKSVMNQWDDNLYVSIDGEDYPPNGVPARNAKGERLLLYIGIIDILQFYRLFKKFEHAWKSVLHDGDTISVHRPGFYSARFKKFIQDNVFKRAQTPLKHSPSKKKARERNANSARDGAAKRNSTAGDATDTGNLVPRRQSMGATAAFDTPIRAPLVKQETSIIEPATSTSTDMYTTPQQQVGAQILSITREHSSSGRRIERLFASTPPPKQQPTVELGDDETIVADT